MTSSITRKNILSFIFLAFSIISFAQSPLVTQKQIGMYINSTTCIVLENELNPYNAFVKDAVQNHWKSTPFEFIDETEFNIRRLDSKYSFLVLMENAFDKDPGGVSYNYISLVLGGNYRDIVQMPELCSVPIQYTNDINTDYEYAIPAIVKFVQLHAKNLEKKRFFIRLYGLKFYNSSGHKDYELLMNNSKMAPNANTIEKISTVYPYLVRLLSTLEIKETIATNPKRTLFHFHVGPNNENSAGRCFEMIFDVDGNLRYYNSKKITNKNLDGFNISDFRQIR
jgi:hypothetical protein